MKKNKKKTLIFTFILFSVLFTGYAENKDDDIFENQKIEDGDFYNIITEPSKKEIQDENSKFFESVKQKKLNILKNIEKERQKLESSKKTLSSATERAKQELEKNKANLKNKTSKKENQTKTEQKSEKKETSSLKQNENVQNSNNQKEKKSVSTKKTQEKTDVQKSKKINLKINMTIQESEQKMDSIIDMRKKFIDEGMDFKGTEYVWGGKTPTPGFDCSGLISYTAKQSLGIDIKGNAQDIYNQTSPVSLEDALPGDLIFFKASTDSRITHVGIYLGKNPGKNDFGTQNLFLNAASAGPRTGVIISGLNENYWKKTFYGCGRIIPEV